jgi:hypothetical protein
MNTVTPVTTVAAVPAVAVPAATEQATTELSVAQPRTILAGGMIVPDYLSETEVEGLDSISKMTVPPRVKVVQDMSRELKALGFQVGDIVLSPANIKIGDAASPLHVTPVFSFTEFLALNDRKSGQFFIREKTSDPRSKLARDAKNRLSYPNPEGAKIQGQTEPWKVTCVEALNFICYLHGQGLFALITFMKAETKYGRKLATLVELRQRSIYAGVYCLEVGEHTNQGGDVWQGFNPSNSALINQGWTPKEMLPAMSAEYKKMKEAFESSMLDAVYEDPTDSETVEANQFAN